jgi:hypothetical protein
LIPIPQNAAIIAAPITLDHEVKAIGLSAAIDISPPASILDLAHRRLRLEP